MKNNLMTDKKNKQSGNGYQPFVHVGDGRFSINSFGYIVDADQACADTFGIEKKSLKRSKIFRFIKRDSKKTFHKHCLKALETKERQSCQLELISRGEFGFPTYVNSKVAYDKNGNLVINCQIVATDKIPAE